jgi:hypothetical protein
MAMSTTVEGTQVARDSVGKRHVTIGLSHLAFEALAGARGDTTARVESALRCYLGDRQAGRPAWPYPEFLRGAEMQKEKQLELDVAEELWTDFSAESTRQGVTAEQLAEHAAFYFAAELEAGRVTQRILDEIELDEGDGTGG